MSTDQEWQPSLEGQWRHGFACESATVVGCVLCGGALERDRKATRVVLLFFANRLCQLCRRCGVLTSSDSTINNWTPPPPPMPCESKPLKETMKKEITKTSVKRTKTAATETLNIHFVLRDGSIKAAGERLLERVFQATEIDSSALVKFLHKHEAKKFIVVADYDGVPTARLLDGDVWIHVTQGATAIEMIDETIDVLAKCVAAGTGKDPTKIREEWRVAGAEKYASVFEIPETAGFLENYRNSSDESDFQLPASLREFNARVKASRG